MKKCFLTILSVVLLMGCQVKPQPITFGKDGCNFCKMTIVDKQHAAEIVTVKGKVFKYDAIECMLNHLKEWEHPEVAYFLASDYSNPGELVDAQQAHYLISENIPSPMGGFLSAFRQKDELINTQSKMNGEAYDWEALMKQYNVTL